MSFGSAFGQDRWVIEEVFPKKRGGYFVEAGALNGVDESNTVRLEREYGWSGLCVEPNTAYFKTLLKERRCRCENVCLLDSESEVDFIEAGGHGGVAKYFSANYSQQGIKTRKKALPLAVLLDRHQAPSVIDYLSLDTEGSEYVILRDFPFQKYQILAMTIEHNHHPRLRQELSELLRANQFVLARSVLVDDWWLHQSVYQSVDPDQRELWRLLNRYPPSEISLRAEETQQRYEQLLTATQSIPKTAALLSRLIRKSMQGKR